MSSKSIALTFFLFFVGIVALFEPLIPLLGFFSFGYLDLANVWDTHGLHAMRVLAILILVATLMKGIGGEKIKFSIAFSLQNLLVIGIILTMISGLIIKEGMSFIDVTKDMWMQEFFKVIFIYIFMVNLIDSRRKLGWATWMLILCVFYLAQKGLANYRTGALDTARPYSWWNKNGAAAVFASGIPMFYFLFWEEMKKRLPRNIEGIFLSILGISLILGGVFLFAKGRAKPGILLVGCGLLLPDKEGMGAKGIFFLGGVVSLLLALWRCGSRGGYLAFIVTFSFLVLIELIRGHYKRLVWILPLVAALLLYKTPEKAWEKFQTIETYEEDASAMIRIDAWKTAIIMLKENPLLGIGMNRYVVHFMDYCPPGSPTYHLGLRSPHSIYVQTFSETGLIGFSLFLILLGKSFWDVLVVIRRSRAGPEKTWLGTMAAAFGLSLLSICVSGAFTGNPYTLGIYGFIALIVATRKLSNEMMKTPAGGKREI
ncbi:MAG: O-antigen ligase family protein [bacterium]